LRLSNFYSRLIYEPTPEQLARLPKLYETEKVPLKDKPIYIHFLIGDCDWFISEYDGEDLFFGYAIIGTPAFAEWGYISFAELKNIRIPPGIQIDCELFDPPHKASEIEEIRIRKGR
jgi:hypothetical protein